MVSGVHGIPGLHVQKHVIMGKEHAYDNATILLPQEEEVTALEPRQMRRDATQILVLVIQTFHEIACLKFQQLERSNQYPIFSWNISYVNNSFLFVNFCFV